MSNFMAKYFGPLNKDYCLYFYVLAVISFIIFLLGLVSSVVALVGMIIKTKHVNYMDIVHSAMILLNSLLAYFVNRLLYTMCLGSVH